MTRDELRLELLKLTYVHGRMTAEAVARARELEMYVIQVPPDDSDKKNLKAGKPAAPVASPALTAGKTVARP